MWRLPYPVSAIPSGGRFGDTVGRSSPHRGVDFSRYHIRRLKLSEWWSFPTEGTITRIVKTDTGVYGRVVEMRDAGDMFWAGCHSDELAALHVGQQVTPDTLIGRVGSSGTAVRVGSEHLHLALSDRAGGYATEDVFDPIAHIESHLATGHGGSSSTFIGEIMSSLLPAVFKIENHDASGKVSSAGLAGVHLVLSPDGHGFVYPADQLQAVLTVSAPYFNSDVPAPLGTSGKPVIVSQENLHILLRDLGYPDLIVEKTALAGGGHFYRNSPAAGDLDEAKLAAALAPLLGGVTDEDLAAAVRDLKASIPAAVIVEQKKPGN